MNHLKETGYSYFGHMIKALGFALRLYKIGFGLLLHSIFPNVLTHYGTDGVCAIFNSLSGGDRILIRFNTKWEEDDLKRNWRVLINGVESLASEIKILVPSGTTEEDISLGVTKWHILCYGKVHWDGNKALVKPY